MYAQGELREELVGFEKAGLSLGIRVIKSRFLIEKEAASGQGAGENLVHASHQLHVDVQVMIWKFLRNL